MGMMIVMGSRTRVCPKGITQRKNRIYTRYSVLYHTDSPVRPSTPSSAGRSRLPLLPVRIVPLDQDMPPRLLLPQRGHIALPLPSVLRLLMLRPTDRRAVRPVRPGRIGARDEERDRRPGPGADGGHPTARRGRGGRCARLVLRMGRLGWGAQPTSIGGAGRGVLDRCLLRVLPLLLMLLLRMRLSRPIGISLLGKLVRPLRGIMFRALLIDPVQALGFHKPVNLRRRERSEDLLGERMLRLLPLLPLMIFPGAHRCEPSGGGDD
ncbi:hypothetical protein CALVIDRAFT_377094 [Calocera viscosa TUFC12733]|uniref:Uncharacterized protein n=1 Tax=Calocera viscosa (strain TUFC12733) TaxID=1330018 RepID=A0A167PZW8_CALVF|nr:hypothetical protein CALVIDRAFT_377094 [Calocera viscosa TUFC12733]